MVKTAVFARMSSDQSAAGLTRAVIGLVEKAVLAVPAVEAKCAV